MQYAKFKVGKTEYKLRAGAMQITELEERLGGKNPLQVLMSIQHNEIPSVSSLLLILHAALQKFHDNMTLEAVYELYDEYVEAGNTYTDLIPVMVETFRVSGFFKAASQETAKVEKKPKLAN